MNYIQKAWLKLLSPVSYFVNQKLAKKSGILGRLGRFYSFGPREFGYHPSMKAIKYANATLIEMLPYYIHKYSVLKSFNQKGHTMLRPHRVFALLGYLAMFSFFTFLFNPVEIVQEDGTSLQFIKSKLPYSPINALEFRTSAHYTEINNYYLHEMMVKFSEKVGEIAQKRAVLPEHIKKTKYARPGYVFIAPHSNVTQKQSS